MKTDAEYKRDERKRKRKLGLIPKEIWVFAEDWPALKCMIGKINKIRLTRLTSQGKVKAD